MNSSLHRTIMIAAVLALGAGACTDAGDAGAGVGTDELGDPLACGDGTDYSLETGGCAPVVDETAAAAVEDPLPDLAELRSGEPTITPVDTTGATTCTDNAPGIGTWYNDGKLLPQSHAILHTKMIAYPNGIDNGTPCFIFTTATNRKQLGVEVVGIYHSGGTPNLGIFDWSCSSGSPCGTKNTASWVYSKSLSSLQACFLKTQDDGGGHQHPLLYYSNESKKLDSQSPPHWRNTVQLWNYCEQKWHRVYQHEYRANNGQHNWSTIIEPHLSGTAPSIKELGFKASALFHDGSWSTLRTDVTSFNPPSKAGFPWRVLHRDPNRGFGITGQ
jgi:hypothetical protein